MTADRISRLTERQKQCLRLVHLRMESKDIAARLGVSFHTVDDHIKSALRTLGVSRRAHAARLLAEHEHPQPPMPVPLGMPGGDGNGLSVGMRILFYNLLLFAIAAYALYRGGAPERLVAILFVVASGATRAVFKSLVNPFVNVEFGFLTIDIVLLVALIFVALHANRFWPMRVAALHMVEVGIHLVKILNPEIIPWVYAVTLGLWSYPMLVLLAWGTYQHHRRLRLYGFDPSWTRSIRREPARWRWLS